MDSKQCLHPHIRTYHTSDVVKLFILPLYYLDSRLYPLSTRPL